MGTDSKQVVERFYASLADIEALKRLLHPQIRLIEAPSLPYGGDFHGIEGLLQVLNSLFASWKDCAVEMKQVVADGDTAVGLIEIRGVGAKSGIPFEMSVAEVFRVRDGLIVEIKPFYFDTHRLFEVHTGSAGASK